MVESHCEILWVNNSGAGLGIHHTSDYGAAADIPDKQAIIYQHCLRYRMLGLWIKNFLTTDDKLNLRAFNSSYTYNNQYDVPETFFVIVKRVRPDTCAGL